VGLGRFLLNPAQLRRLGGFYDRWGLPAIFFARFLPGLRAMVPVFAGVTGQSFPSVAFPVFVASGIWYGCLVWLGATAGKNLSTVGEWVGGANRVLLVLALIVMAAALVWWIMTRRAHESEEEE
jgi:undecaprenyl-diphosphatase